MPLFCIKCKFRIVYIHIILSCSFGVSLSSVTFGSLFSQHLEFTFQPRKVNKFAGLVLTVMSKFGPLPVHAKFEMN